MRATGLLHVMVLTTAKKNYLSTKLLFVVSSRRSIAMIAAVMFAISALATDLEWNFKFNTSEVTLSHKGDFTRISLSDCSDPCDVIGAPAIPAKYANILLPNGATDVKVSASGDLVLLASDVTPWPVQRPVPKSKPLPPFTAPDSVAYASAAPWPAVAATFEGLHQMQGSTFVSVRVNPLVYVAAEKKLYYRPVVNVTVSYTLPRNAAARGVARDALANEMVNALVVNPTNTSSTKSTTAPRGSMRDATDKVDYLIITDNVLSNAFQNLADYRATEQGGSFNTRVVKISEIESHYEGDDVPMKIRNCIIDYYQNHGTTYVVLGGDDSRVPVRYTYAQVGGTKEWHMPTDLYYSDLTGTWKADGLDDFGIEEANVDMSPEVIVGRIPVRTGNQLNDYLAKVEAFETDLTHSRNSIILGGPAAWCRYYGDKRPTDDVTGDGHRGFRDRNGYASDSEMWLRRLYRDGIKPFWDNVESEGGRTIHLATDAITSWDAEDCGDTPLTGKNLQSWLNNTGYTHLMFSGHGYPQGWGLEGQDDNYYTEKNAAALEKLTPFVYTDACLTGAFDEDGIKSTGITVDTNTEDPYTYTSEPCLGEAFLRNPNGGSLVHMGCSRYGWGYRDYQGEDPDDEDADGMYIGCTASNTSDGGPSTVYAYKFYHRLYEGDAVSANRTVGQAFAMSKADMISECANYDCERWIQFGLNYLGDPAITLYPRAEAPAVAKPTEVTVNYTGGDIAEVSWTSTETAWDINVNGIVTEDVTNPYTLTNLQLATNYNVIVRAKNANGVSSWSAPATFTTDLSYDNCQISFGLTDSYGDGWNGAYIQVEDVLTESIIGTVSNTNEANADEVQTYTMTVPNDRDIRFVWGSGKYDSECSYVVYDVNGEVIFSGNGAMSSAVTYHVDCTVTPWRTPTNLAASNIRPHSTVLSWTENTNPAATAWVVAYKAESASDFTEIEANTNPYTLTNLDSETEYTVKVRPVTDDATIKWSTETTFITPSQCDAPNTLAASDTTHNTATLTWTGYQDSYNVRYRTKTTFNQLFFEDFEAGIPSTWTTIDADGDGNNWLALSEIPTTYPGDDDNSSSFSDWAHSGSDAASSPSYVYSSLNTDHWLITPQLNLQGTLKFYATSEYSDPDSYEVLLSTTGTATTNFTTTLQTMTEASSDSWDEVSIDLSSYHGQQGYIAIHHVSSDKYFLVIDDFELYEPVESEWQTTTTDETTLAVTGLMPDTEYEWQVQGINTICGTTEWSSLAFFTTLNLIELADDATDNGAIIDTLDDETVSVALTGRTLYKDGEWNTICLPFNLTLADSPLEGAMAKTLTDAEMNGTTVSLTFSDAVDELQAGIPYIIKWQNGENIVNPVFSGVTIDKADRSISKADGHVQFKGYYDAFDIDASDMDIYYMSTGNKLRHTGKARTLNGCRAYFQFSENALAAREYRLDFGDETTGISEKCRVKSEEFATAAGWYTLDGRKLDKQPMKKGVYIYNGRKAVLK